jgi:hypothetical protein
MHCVRVSTGVRNSERSSGPCGCEAARTGADTHTGKKKKRMKRKERPSETTKKKETAAWRGVRDPPDVRRYRDALCRLGYVPPGRGNEMISFSAEQDAIFAADMSNIALTITRASNAMGIRAARIRKVDKEVGLPSERTAILRRKELEQVQKNLDSLTKTIGAFQRSVEEVEIARLKALTERKRPPTQPNLMDKLLPDEMVLAIVEWLTPPATTALACTCRRMASLTSDGKMWKHKFVRYMRMACVRRTVRATDDKPTKTLVASGVEDTFVRATIENLSLAQCYLPNPNTPESTFQCRGEEYRRAHRDATTAFWREVCLRLYALEWTSRCALCRERPQNSYHLQGLSWLYENARERSPATAAVLFDRWWHDRAVATACPYCHLTMLITFKPLVGCGLLLQQQFSDNRDIASAMWLRAMVRRDRHDVDHRPRYFVEDVLAAVVRGHALRFVPNFQRPFDPEQLLPLVEARFGTRSSVHHHRPHATIGACSVPSHKTVSWSPNPSLHQLFIPVEPEPDSEESSPPSDGEQQENKKRKLALDSPRTQSA